MTSSLPTINQQWVFTGGPSLIVLEGLLREWRSSSEGVPSIRAMRVSSDNRDPNSCRSCLEASPSDRLAIESLRVASLVPLFIPDRQVRDQACSDPFCQRIKTVRRLGATVVLENASDRLRYYLNHPPSAIDKYAHILWNRPNGNSSDQQERLAEMCGAFFESAKKNPQSPTALSVTVYYRLFDKQTARSDKRVIISNAENNGYSLLLRDRMDTTRSDGAPSTFIELIFTSGLIDEKGYEADSESE